MAYYANELSINEMKPGDWLVAPCCHVTPTLKEHNLLFRVGERLGIGSYGEVIEVEHKVDGSRYAVKILEKTSENMAETDVEEAKRMCHMLHANVCRYYNAWQEGGFVRIRMELCDKDLAKWIEWRNNLLFEKEPKPSEDIRSEKEPEPPENIRSLLKSWIDLSRDQGQSGKSSLLPSQQTTFGKYRRDGGKIESNASACRQAQSTSQQTWFRSVKAEGTNDFLKGLLKGVRYLHDDQHMAHQDLHAMNVLLKISCEKNTVTAKICDFGLAARKSTRFCSRTLDGFCQDLQSVGAIMMRMYYPLYGEAMDDLLSKLRKSNAKHATELNPDFHKLWPDQALWIRRLLSSDETKPKAAQMLDEGMRSESRTFPSVKYDKGREDGKRDQSHT